MDAQPLVPNTISGLQKRLFSSTWSTLFVVNALIVFTCSTVGLWSMLMSIFVSPFDIVLFVYLIAFSLVLLIVDSPLGPTPKVVELSQAVFKYCLFLTRFCGRGVFYMFLGTMLTGVLWDNNVSPFFGLVAGTFLFGTGAFVLYHGVNLSRKLQSVKTALLNRGGPTGSICPPQGLRKEKFAEIADKMQGVKFTKDELAYIARAMSLTFHADEIISQREFESWMTDSNPLII